MGVYINTFSFCVYNFSFVFFRYFGPQWTSFMFVSLGFFHVKYIVIVLCRQRNLLLDTCFCHPCSILYRVWQCLEFFTTTWHTFIVRKLILIRCKGTHCCRVHECFYFVYMKTMWHHSIIIGFKNATFNFTRAPVVRSVTLVFQLFQIKIALC